MIALWGKAVVADVALLVQVAYMGRFTPIFHALSREGWSFIPQELAVDCWWAKNIWQLRSEWTPKDCIVYLSLLVDPMEEIDRNNIPDTAVWAVGLSAKVPQSRLEAEKILVPIKRRMNNAIEEVINEASRLRMAR